MEKQHTNRKECSVKNSNPTTFQFSHHPLPIRFLNWFGKAAECCGISLVSLSETSLLKAAYRRTGLYDWGDDSFRIPMKILLASLEEEAKFNLVGRQMFRQDTIKILINRLRIQDELKRHPEILQEKINRPLFIIGLPRTGTTLLHNLLAQDPSSRALLTWEMLFPWPPPERHTRETDPRIAKTKRRLRQLLYLAPNFNTIHPVDAKAPNECMFLLQYSFLCRGAFELIAPVRRYIKWLGTQDMVPVYLYYRQLLQLLQWRCSAHHWVLKAPVHMFSLDALLTVFPDACVVHMHRDPCKVVPSCCSLFATFKGMYSDHLDVKRLGQECTDRLADMVVRAIKVRDSTDHSTFFDVHYKNLLKDPIDIVHQIYAYFGYNYTNHMEERMHRWLSENPQHKHGIHRYSLEQFYLDPAVIKTRFSKYFERFKISIE